jgi:heptosyltransferase-1
VQAGFRVLLPWGNAQEEARAKRLATGPGVQVLPRLELSEIGYVLAKAKACVCMDTGLSHLAAALDVPAVTLYGSTDSGLIGASGASQVHIKSDRFCSPCQSKTCRYSSGDNPCLEEIAPERVFGDLLRLTGPALKPVPVSPVSAVARRAS